MTAYGINPQSGNMIPCDEELGETLTVCHQGGVLVSGGIRLYVDDQGGANITVVKDEVSPTILLNGAKAHAMIIAELEDSQCSRT